MTMRHSIQGILILSVALLLAGCFGRSEPTPDPAEMIVRTPRPTFTPTPPVPTETPLPATPVAENVPVSGEKPLAVVNDEFVYSRTDPSLDSPVVRIVTRGEEFEIIGRTEEGDWWQVCCVEGVQAWIFSEFLDTIGPVDNVQASLQVQAQPTATPTEPPVDSRSADRTTTATACCGGTGSRSGAHRHAGAHRASGA